MIDEARTHVGISHRTRNADGGHTDITINLSGIPASSSEGLLAVMMGQARAGLDLLLTEVESRLRQSVQVERSAPPARRVDISAFTAPMPSDAEESLPVTEIEPMFSDTVTPDENGEEPDPFAATPAVAIDLESNIDQLCRAIVGVVAAPRDELVVIEAEPEPEPPSVDEPLVIPSDDDVHTGAKALGLWIPAPIGAWHDEPLSRTSETGEHGGQLVAVNAALSGLGYGGKLRHPAALSILQAYGPIDGRPARESLDSISDLTKAEAHVILTWVTEACNWPEAALPALARAVAIVRDRHLQEALIA